MQTEIRVLLDALDAAFLGTSWHGTTLAGSLRGVTPPQARWRPGPRRHTIWELALHTAYWKYVVTRRITGDEVRGGFPRSPSNWPSMPGHPDAKTWKADVQLLKRMHAELRAAVAALPAMRLRKRSPSGKWTYGQLVSGVAAHDLYHTGQIQLIKRLMKR
ncbi:MAG: DinB family protein [Gemmatimonadota bacterium]|nr:DinB family protein [Gemmatimonadota bacterium]